MCSRSNVNKKGSYAKGSYAEGFYFPSAFFPRLLATHSEQGLQSSTEGIQWLGVTGGNNPPDTPPSAFLLLPSAFLKWYYEVQIVNAAAQYLVDPERLASFGSR